jgi:hypothetical protein
MAKEGVPQYGYMFLWLIDFIMTTIVLVYLLNHKPSDKWKHLWTYSCVYVGLLMGIALWNVISSYMGCQVHLSYKPCIQKQT